MTGTPARKSATAQQAAEPEKIERPSLGDAYEDLSYNDDQAIKAAFGVEMDDLFDALNETKIETNAEGRPVLREDGTPVRNNASTTHDWFAAIMALEFAHLTHQGVSPAEAEAEVKGYNKRHLSRLMVAYLDHIQDAMEDEPDTDEGKGDSASA